MFDKDGVPGAKTGGWVNIGAAELEIHNRCFPLDFFCSLLLDDQQHLRLRGGVRPRALPLVGRPARGAARRGRRIQHALRRPLLDGNELLFHVNSYGFVDMQHMVYQ